VVLTRLKTASAVISFAANLEGDMAKLYEDLARRYPEGREIFLSFSKGNGQNRALLERAYYEAITDAIEACFSFEEGLDPGAYALDAKPTGAMGFADALRFAIEAEGRAKGFYEEAARLSKGLMADIPRAFEIIARKRGDRIAKLKALAEGLGPA